LSRRARIGGRAAEKLGERERQLGLDSDDEASRWLAEHDPPPATQQPKSLGKSKALHRWKQRSRKS
jgi:hypothetical protein